MKKIFSTLLVLMLVLSMAFAVVGCGSETVDDKNENETTEPVKEEEKKEDKDSEKDNEDKNEEAVVPDDEETVTPDKEETVVPDDEPAAPEKEDEPLTAEQKIEADKIKLVGTWKGSTNAFGEELAVGLNTFLAEIIKTEELPAEFDVDAYKNISVPVTITFEEPVAILGELGNGGYTLRISEEDAEKVADEFAKLYKETLTSMVDYLSKKLDLTTDEVMKYIELNTTIDEEVARMKADLKENIVMEKIGTYAVEEGKICYGEYETDNYWAYTRTGNTLTLVLNEKLTIVFEKQA